MEDGIRLKCQDNVINLYTKSVDSFLYILRKKEIKRVIKRIGFTEYDIMLYRGHNNSNWSLMPTALRNYCSDVLTDMSNCCYNRQDECRDKILREIIKRYKVNKGDNILQIMAEYMVTKKYEFLLKRYNVEINRKKVLNVLSDDYRKILWPCMESVPVLVLAQHYGLYTRFLDWTRNEMVACYFAAFSKTGIESDNIAVWVFVGDSQKRNSYYYIPISNDVGGYMEAQEGAMLILKDNCLHYNEILNMNSSFEGYMKNNNVCDYGLVKVMLPVSEAPKLLGRLEKKGYDSVSLFPDVHGVVDAMYEKRRGYVKDILKYRYVDCGLKEEIRQLLYIIDNNKDIYNELRNYSANEVLDMLNYKVGNMNILNM